MRLIIAQLLGLFFIKLAEKIPHESGGCKDYYSEFQPIYVASIIILIY
ncbi:hypothetical protein Ppb6_03265 [Photorhabdus australis subsp. thailandensis]|uniref:Uncharacterized protein n=1 Tax=Photorhabdus australis subsp. thailandensis TaxID=2805096 RepID=A0A1C0U0V4_9GAMM|nr:hypothetical protein Ppb6_03265 [Photorhabdus australis subsp. thailandensis]